MWCHKDFLLCHRTNEKTNIETQLLRLKGFLLRRKTDEAAMFVQQRIPSAEQTTGR